MEDLMKIYCYTVLWVYLWHQCLFIYCRHGRLSTVLVFYQCFAHCSVLSLFLPTLYWWLSRQSLFAGQYLFSLYLHYSLLLLP